MNIKLEKKAIKFCEDNKHRLSMPRLEVLRIIISSEKPITAYEVLAKLGKKLTTLNLLQFTEQLIFGLNITLFIELKA